MSDAVADATPQKKGERRKRQGKTLVRWDEAEGLIVAGKAERCGLTMAGYFRAAALGEAGPRAVRRPPIEKTELVRLLGLAGNMASNWNQIARVVNTTGNQPMVAELNGIRESLVILRRELMHALGRGPAA